MATVRRRLGEILKDKGLVTDAQIEEALALARRRQSLQPLGMLLVELGYVTEDDIRQALAAQMKAG